jgi:hypothetical protein
VEQQNSDGFSSHSPPRGFLGHQSHGPPGAAFGRVAADHGDDALLLAVLQQGRGFGPLLLIHCAFEGAFLVTMANLPNGLRRQRDNAGNARRTDALG